MDVSGVKRKQPDDEGFSEVYQMPSKFYITLAKESPRESICCESDDATYDSFHGRETGTMFAIVLVQFLLHRPFLYLSIHAHTLDNDPSVCVSSIGMEKRRPCNSPFLEEEAFR